MEKDISAASVEFLPKRRPSLIAVVDATDIRQQGDAIEFRHHQVGEHQFELAGGVQNGESFHAGRGLPGLIAGSIQHRGYDFPYGFLIVNNKNALYAHLEKNLLEGSLNVPQGPWKYNCSVEKNPPARHFVIYKNHLYSIEIE